MPTVTEVVSYVKACAQSGAWSEITRGHLAGDKAARAFFIKEKREDWWLAVPQAMLDAYILYQYAPKPDYFSQYAPYVVAGGYLLVGGVGGMRTVQGINALGTTALVFGQYRTHPKQAITFLATVGVWAVDKLNLCKRIWTPFEGVSTALRGYAICNVLAPIVWPRVCTFYQSLRPYFPSITAAQASIVVDALRG
jgi:hypothetical protein